MCSIPDSSILFADESRGIYIPSHFADCMKDHRADLLNVNDETFNIISDPDCEWYWDAWADVLENAIVLDHKGNRHTMYHDGDLWLIPESAEWGDV